MQQTIQKDGIIGVEGQNKTMKNNSNNNSNDQEQNDRPMVNQQNTDSEKQQILKKKQNSKTMNSTDSRLLSKGSKPEQKTVDQQLKSRKVSNSQLSKQNRPSKIQFQNSTVSKFTEIVPQCQCRWSKWINNNNYSPLRGLFFKILNQDFMV